MTRQHRERKASDLRIRVISALVIAVIASPLSPSQGKGLAENIRSAFDALPSTWRLLRAPSLDPKPAVGGQTGELPSDRADRVQHLRLCPRRLQLHVEESFTLVPLPLDSNRKTVHSAAMTWSSSNTNVARVTSYGEVVAISRGSTVVAVQVGTKRASVMVEVAAGVRPSISDQEWDRLHANDCDSPEAAELIQPNRERPNDRDALLAQQPEPKGVMGRRRAESHRAGDAKDIDDVTKAGLESPVSRSRGSSVAAIISKERPLSAKLKYSTQSSLRALRPSKLQFIAKANLKAGAVKRTGRAGARFQGEIPNEFFSQATTIDNAIGTPRLSPVEETRVNSIKTKNNLGSSNYGFAAPILGLDGRGVDVNLISSYNAQLWGKDTNGTPTKMVFDYNKVGSAPGWSAGYGRIIRNYDNTLTGDGSSNGALNAPGNYLLIESDGTRVQLTQLYDTPSQTWNHTSADGLFTSFNPRSKTLRYFDGTAVAYFIVNNKLQPKKIKNTNGEVVSIDYRLHNPVSFPNRFAINQISDNLGRIIRFYYYGDPEYPAGPFAKLAAVTAPDQGSGSRTMIRVEYQTITLQYNFQSAYQIDAPASNTPLTVVRRLYYPATGRGYLFLDYSSYGMCRHLSMRSNMTGSGGAITDGAEIAYSQYNFVDINSQVGQLNDAPQYTERREWWQGKIDGSSPTLYTYQRVKNGSTDTATVIEPLTNLQTVTTSSSGQVSSVEQKNGTTVMSRIDYFYLDVFDPTRLTDMVTTDDAGNTATARYEYGSYNRVTNIYETGFSGTTIRRTRYQYSDAAAHIDRNMLRLVTQMAVFDGSGTMTMKTNLTYDDYAIKGGLEYYGLTPSTYPPNHDANFDQTYTTRGNVTGVETFSSISPSISTTRYSKYDVFGNVVEADVSCCQVKTVSFGWSTIFSQPDSTTDGRPGVVPYLTTNYLYDFNTGLVTQATDPNGLTTFFTYDSAWRLLTVTAPQSAYAVTTRFDKDANQNDLLAYSQKMVYTDTDNIQKTTWSKSWFDGAGRVVRAGSTQGTSPTSFDTRATQYDSIGRLLKQSNPYLGDSSGNGSPAFWTTNVYDPLSRVTEVDLPDDQPLGQRSRILTNYNGAVVTVTDQVGRMRKSQVDALGRLISVTEQDPANGVLSLVTNYSYDALDSLLLVNQGGQQRSFVYDALSRLTSETTPEGGTIALTYTDFNSVLKRTHQARGVETHYKYDTLNRTQQTWHTGLGGNDSGTIRPPLPAAVAATADIVVNYNNFATAQPGNGQISSLTDGAGSESYLYDSLARMQSKTRAIDSRSYETQYQYNNANQLALLIYPSGKRVRMNHDLRGRMSGLDKVDNAGNVLSTYMNGVTYRVEGMVSALSLGNGVNESYGYSNDRLQLTSQSAVKGQSTLMSFVYSYAASAGASGAGTTAGNSGQLMSIAGTIDGAARNQAFTYDNMGRVRTATGWGLWSRRFTYDRWGNRTKTEESNGAGGWCTRQEVTLKPPPNGANRPTTVKEFTQCTFSSSSPFKYDAAGNTTSYGTGNGWISHVYDAESRLVRFQNGSGQALGQYTYDAANRRVKKVAGAVTTYYVWEGSQVIAEYSGTASTPTFEYVFAGSRMLSREQSGVLRFYHQDRLSTRLITDSSGGWVGTQDHLPFGEESPADAHETEKHSFTTYERDTESNTDYAINRQYGTAVGRFLRPDPIQGSIANPQSLNRYAYVRNDPVNLIDPLGLECYEICSEANGERHCTWECDISAGDYDEESGNPQGPISPERPIVATPNVVIVLTFTLGNCGVNPVTGKRGFSGDPKGTLGNLRPGRGGGGDFGASRRNAQTGVRYEHQGLDISGTSGDSIIYAYEFGKVIGVSNDANSRTGKLVKIQHFDLNRTVTTYMHNSENWVRVGQYVRTGQPIALLGQTGNAQGQPAAEAHVHFQATRGGDNIDPKGILNGPCIQVTVR